MLIINVNFLLALFGGVLILVGLLADIFISSTSGIGLLQMAAFVIGGILLLFGLRCLVIPEQPKWNWLFVAVYLSGMLFMGLRSNNEYGLHENIFLTMHSFNLQDLSINIIGFLPFGFLLMAALSISWSIGQSIFITVLTAFLVSLSIESMQFCCVPGRYSSGYDLLANTFAAVLGTLVYFGYSRLISYQDNKNL